VAVGTGTVIYTVPSGATAIVKSVSITNTFTSAGILNLTVVVAGGGSFFVFYNATFAPQTNQNLSLWIVLQQGDSLCYGSNVSGTQVYASGAELTNVP